MASRPQSFPYAVEAESKYLVDCATLASHLPKILAHPDTKLEFIAQMAIENSARPRQPLRELFTFNPQGQVVVNGEGATAQTLLAHSRFALDPQKIERSLRLNRGFPPGHMRRLRLINGREARFTVKHKIKPPAFESAGLLPEYRMEGERVIDAALVKDFLHANKSQRIKKLRLKFFWPLDDYRAQTECHLEIYFGKLKPRGPWGQILSDRFKAILRAPDLLTPERVGFDLKKYLMGALPDACSWRALLTDGDKPNALVLLETEAVHNLEDMPSHLLAARRILEGAAVSATLPPFTRERVADNPEAKALVSQKNLVRVRSPEEIALFWRKYATLTKNASRKAPAPFLGAARLN